MTRQEQELKHDLLKKISAYDMEIPVFLPTRVKHIVRRANGKDRFIWSAHLMGLNKRAERAEREERENSGSGLQTTGLISMSKWEGLD